MVNVESTKPNLDFAVKEYAFVQPAANQSLGAAWADITGWSLTIPRDGFYKIRIDGCFEVDDANNNGQMGAAFRLAVGGVGDNTTVKDFFWNGIPNGTDVIQGLELEVYQNFSAGDVLTLQGILNTAGDTAQIFGTVATRMARMYYELLNAYVPINIESYDTGWIICNDWTNQHLGTIVGGNVAHNLGTPLTNLIVKIYVSSDGTEANAIEIPGWIYAGGVTTYGVETHAVDNDNLLVQTGASGVDYVQDASGQATLVPNGWRYKIKVYRLI